MIVSTISRQAVVAVPERFEADHCRGAITADLALEMTNEILLTVMRDAKRTDIACSSAIWVVACNETVDQIDTLPYSDGCEIPGDKCPTCLAGRDQARAYVKEHPGKHVAIGLLTFEVVR